MPSVYYETSESADACADRIRRAIEASYTPPPTLTDHRINDIRTLSFRILGGSTFFLGLKDDRGRTLLALRYKTGPWFWGLLLLVCPITMGLLLFLGSMFTTPFVKGWSNVWLFGLFGAALCLGDIALFWFIASGAAKRMLREVAKALNASEVPSTRRMEMIRVFEKEMRA